MSNRRPITRRSLLLGLGSVSIAALLSSCDRPSDSTLRVQLLKDSLPPQLLSKFQQQVNSKIAVNSAAQIADLFKLLQTAQQPQTGGLLGRRSAAADLVSLGDSWLEAAIAQNLLQPLDLQESAAWQSLPQRWRDLAQRNSPAQRNSQIWAAPYRWGTLMIVYRRDAFDRLDWKIEDWADLWRSPLQGKLGLIDSPRVAIGATLKKLGQSFNAENLGSVPNLQAELRSLHQQTRFYSSEAYLQPLLLGQIWAAIGWSFEILPLVERNYKLGAVIPPSGTLLNADLWVRPQSDRPVNPLLNQLIEFCWQPDIATAISLLSDAASPILEGDRANLPEALRNDGLKFPSAAVIDRSEFLQPLPKATVDQYRRLWESVRA